MAAIADSIFIRCAPEKAYRWFLSLDKNYKTWHPDHVECTFSSPDKIGVGTIITCREYLHRKMHVMRMRVASLVPNEAIVYENLFPTSILSPKGSFLFKREKDGTLFTATLEFRFGGLLAKVFRYQFAELEKHVKEEGVNLKAVLE